MMTIARIYADAMSHACVTHADATATFHPRTYGDWFMPPSSGNLVDLPRKEASEGFTWWLSGSGEASAQSDLGDSEPMAGDEGLLCR